MPSARQSGRESHPKTEAESLCELGPDGLEPLTQEIQALGYDRETAAKYALLIGDIPCIDKDGKTVVIDHKTGEVFARLALNFFGTIPSARRLARSYIPRKCEPGTLLCLPDAEQHYIKRDRAAFIREFTAHLMVLGHPEETSSLWARLFAKNPCQDETGKIVIIQVDENGLTELAHLDIDLWPYGSRKVIYLDGDCPV